MVVDVKLSRDEPISWGFRLAGGADFDTPLTVTKVNEGSIAEDSGLRVGDIVVRVNYEPTIDLPHSKVQEMIINCANSFVLGVKREGDSDENNENHGPIYPIDANQSQEFLNKIENERPESAVFSEFSETTINSCGVDSISGEFETPKTDEQIADVISGEAEVLKEHNVIGVNFQRMIPQAGFFKSSEVFKQLNEEAVKTKAERDKDVKKWTTFLQKPNRPIPQPKNQNNQIQSEPYRINIVKQPKPKCDPNRPASPFVISQEEPKRIDEKLLIEDTIYANVETTPCIAEVPLTSDTNDLPVDIADSEVPDLEPCTEEELIAYKLIVEQQNQILSEQNEAILVEENNQKVENEDRAIEAIENLESQSIVPSSKPNNPEDEILEQRLVEVQNQLAALSSLPSTIQATLESVSRQLAELMPAFRIRTSIDISGCMNDESNLKLTENIDIEKGTQTEESKNNIQSASNIDVSQQTQTAEIDVSIKETGDIHMEITKAIDTNGNGIEIQNGNNEIESVDEIALSTDEHLMKMKTEKTFMQQESEWIKIREKTLEEKHQAIAESVAKKAQEKASNGPRTPQERPQVLPGGRKWRNAKDAYNEDFIAEILSSQAELITGSTLGKYESPLLGYDDRVNFLKYKKPEKDLSNLNHSEVLKLINNSESNPTNQISQRPEKIVAAEDVCPANRR